MFYPPKYFVLREPPRGNNRRFGRFTVATHNGNTTRSHRRPHCWIQCPQGCSRKRRYPQRVSIKSLPTTGIQQGATGDHTVRCSAPRDAQEREEAPAGVHKVATHTWNTPRSHRRPHCWIQCTQGYSRKRRGLQRVSIKL